jgi:hypothetical protein
MTFQRLKRLKKSKDCSLENKIILQISLHKALLVKIYLDGENFRNLIKNILKITHVKQNDLTKLKMNELNKIKKGKK